jgi:hypothetical protein
MKFNLLGKISIIIVSLALLHEFSLYDAGGSKTICCRAAYGYNL